MTMKNSLTKVIGTRFDEKTFDLIEKVTNAQGIDVSDFIRLSAKRELARLSFLSEDEKKALEVKPIEKGDENE